MGRHVARLPISRHCDISSAMHRSATILAIAIVATFLAGAAPAGNTVFRTTSIFQQVDLELRAMDRTDAASSVVRAIDDATASLKEGREHLAAGRNGLAAAVAERLLLEMTRLRVTVEIERLRAELATVLQNSASLESRILELEARRTALQALPGSDPSP